MENRGFTLVELIITIAITGILAAMTSTFIARPIQGYMDTANRAALTDMADLALKRMSLEIRNALPNSVRETPVSSGSTEVEFIPTIAGGRYCTDLDSDCTNPLGFDSLGTGASNDSFVFLGLNPADLAVSAGDQLVVFNTGQTDLDAYAGNNRRDVSRSGNTLTLTGSALTYPSPTNRFHIAPSTGPVKFRCANNELRRYTGYGYDHDESDATSNALLLSGTTLSCDFYYTQVSAANGLLSLRLTVGNAGGSITLSNQIHVNNMP